ncbi:MAG TPA: HEAT repeat domain-containing protein [Solirubrobacteraceae bacterium]|nr:HEAT repeat domain-containing protein [Solirubrobacteraceae bacterium]
MSTPELIDRLASSDFNERAKALAALVQQGRAAAPALTQALAASDDGIRIQAARALAEIGDPATADALAAATGDANADVRAHAAVGLAHIGDDRALDALIATIDYLPDPLRHPYTASVRSLIGLGTRSLGAVAPLLSAEDPNTREHAFLVVRSVVSTIADWDTVWDALGRYDPAAEPAARETAAAQWAEWIREHA